MREAGLRASWKRKFVSTTDSKHTLPVAENVLNRQFEVAQPNRAWVSDITYIRTAQGWLYLAVVLDLYSRKVVGWAMAPTMPAGLVISALSMALQQRRPPPGLVLHSDRGSQGGFNRSSQHWIIEQILGTRPKLPQASSSRGFFGALRSTC
jgi:transposase InsO family protein